MIRSINGFNSRCLHVMTGEHYRETATAPAYDLVLAVRKRRLHYLGHVLRMPADRMVQCALVGLVIDASHCYKLTIPCIYGSSKCLLLPLEYPGSK